MNSTFPILRVAALWLLFFSSAVAVSGREVLDFDKGWRFTLEDQPGAEAPKFDDSAWRTLNVPHDWAFESEYKEDAAQTDKGGYKPGGIGWYRKAFKMPAGWDDKQVSIHFDGAYMNSEVWVNGKLLGKRPYGYIPFHYDLTEHLLSSGENVISVRLDNSLEPSARWYHGCGIYAHVNLVATDSVHVPKGGVFIRTPEIGKDQAMVEIDTEIANTSEGQVDATLTVEILDPDGKEVAKASSSLIVATGNPQLSKLKVSVPQPALWNTETPHLYTAISRVSVDGKEVDKVETRFGIREIRWEVATGFWLNGKNVKLLGVADHLEGGPVGAASSDEIIRWKLQLLKDMGCNAIRCAHNPQVPAFYDLCDEMGILLMDEIFDGWKVKAPEDYGKQAFNEWWERDLRTWLKANRNHPSVIVWSFGNETHGDMAKEMVAVSHEMDPTRLTTSGSSSSEYFDVLGVNGGSEKMSFYAKAKETPPDKPFVSTEAPHTWQVRGFYRTRTWWRDGYPNKRQSPFPLPDLTKKEIFTYSWTAPKNLKNRKQLFNSSYDNATVRISARKNWALMRDLPWHAGHFRWTGFDYIGEAGYVHGGWPFRAFMGGPLDLAGFKKDLFYFYQSQWTRKPMAHILPHWTHPKMEAGTKIPVWVYSNCDEVELFLNGESLGKDKPGTNWDEMQCEWMVPWALGKLEAVGTKDGKEVARAVQETAGAPAKLKLSVEGKKSPIVTIAQVDEKGIMNPYGENRVHYHIDGPARIVSLESGNPVNTENNTGQTSRSTFFGLGRCFLENTADSGDISLVVGAILGEKQVMTSNKVSIDVKSLAIRGSDAEPEVKILYSTNGSDPKTPYTGPFEIQPDTEVIAEVFDGETNLFRMTERFGPNEGIYWGVPGEAEAGAIGGDQAEDAKFEGAIISTKGADFRGKGFLDFTSVKGAYVEWYQENDGSAGEFKIQIRYSGASKKGKKGRKMKLTVNSKDQVLDFPPTADYGIDWQTMDVKVQMEPGANTIRLSTVEKGGMCIDEIRVQ